jgi:hypothetical protein
MPAFSNTSRPVGIPCKLGFLAFFSADSLAWIIHQVAVGGVRPEGGSRVFVASATRWSGFGVAPKGLYRASGPVGYGGSLAMLAARLAKSA